MTASSQLGIAENYFVQGQIPNAIADFESIANSFPGTKAAGTAVYYLGRIANIQKDFVKAEEYFRKYLKEYKNDPLYKASSMAGIAVCFENKQQYLEAAGWYADAWKTDKKASSAAFFLDNAAMNYRLAGDTAKSRETYQAIIDEYPESSLANRAGYLIEML